MLRSLWAWLQGGKRAPAANPASSPAAEAAVPAETPAPSRETPLVPIGAPARILSSLLLIELGEGWNIESLLADVSVGGTLTRMRIRALVCPTRRHAWQQMPRLSDGLRRVCPPERN